LRSAGVPWGRYVAALAFLDALAMFVAALVAETARFGSLGRASTDPGGAGYLMASLLMAPAWLAALGLGGAYERRHLGSGSEEYRRVLSAAARFLSLLAILALLVGIDIARIFIAVTIPLGALLTLLARHQVRRWLYRQRRQGRFMSRVLVVGSENSVRQLTRDMRMFPHTGLAVSAACLADVATDSLNVDGTPVPIAGRADDLLEIVAAENPDAVLIADGSVLSLETFREVAGRLEGTGVTLFVAPAVSEVAGPFAAIRPVSGLPILTVEEPELGGARRLVKEALDRAAAVVALIVLLPALLVVGVAVRLTSPGPALFKQVRVGLRGRRFVLWKFRTMVVDAEEHRATLLDLNEHDGPLFKIRDDPRITRLGRFLRRWSVDELPQLWNVARGEMSLVGPRPPLPSEVENYCSRARRRLLVKPGLTGLWQISGRAGLAWEDAVRLDLHYVENWSPSLDLAILAKTVSAVLRRNGAY